jgi:hypothetical protein
MQHDRAFTSERLWRCQTILERWTAGEISDAEALEALHELSRNDAIERIGETYTPEVQSDEMG